MVLKNQGFLTWRSLFGDFFHSEFLSSQKATIHLHFQKWSLLAFSDDIV